jgi:hypothetical protein
MVRRIARHASEFMRPRGLARLAWLGWIAIAGCRSSSSDAGYDPVLVPAPTGAADSLDIACADAGKGGAPTCPVSPGLLSTPQMQRAVHDLRRLGLATEIRDQGQGRVALSLGEGAMDQSTPLAYHLERFYRAYRDAYALGDAVRLELWWGGRQVGDYTDQGLYLGKRR